MQLTGPVDDYEVACGHDEGGLKADVRRLLAKGFEPIGGISTRDGDGRIYQAMVHRQAAPGTTADPGEVVLVEPIDLGDIVPETKRKRGRS